MKPSNNSKLKIKDSKIIIIIGPPGSGKGTQAELLAERFNFFHWETSAIIGKIIEQARKDDFLVIKGKKYYFQEQKERREKGLLWDSDFVFYLTEKKIKELTKQGKGIVMSGSPRTISEGERLIPLLKKLYKPKNIKVIVLKVSPKETIWRNTHRKECELVHHSILYSKETEKLTVCPLDGSKLIKRKDDDPEVIKKRLNEYERETFPLINLFKKQKLKVSEINGEQSVANVFQDILKSLED